MAHFAKFTRGAVNGGLTLEYEHQKKENGEYFGTGDIHPEKSHLNINLAPEREGGQLAFLNKRCSEVKCLKRDDVNVMCSWLTTAPKDLPEKDRERFFQAVYNYLCKKYGEENVVSAWVHYDESQPHMHFAFVPVVRDKKKGHEKVSAKEAVTLKDLQTFHQDLDKHLTAVFGRDIGILNGATERGNKTVEMMKLEAKIAELQQKSQQDQQELARQQENLKGVRAEYERFHKYRNDLEKEILPYQNMKDKFEKVDNIGLKILPKIQIAGVQIIPEVRLVKESSIADVAEQAKVNVVKDVKINTREHLVAAKEFEAEKLNAQKEQAKDTIKQADDKIKQANDIIEKANSISKKVIADKKQVDADKKQVDALYQKQLGLNEFCEKQGEEIKMLKGMVESLKAEFNARLRVVYKGFSILLKYGKDKLSLYKAPLNELQGLLVNVNQAAAQAKEDGFLEIAKAEMELSPSIEKAIKDLEPKPEKPAPKHDYGDRY